MHEFGVMMYLLDAVEEKARELNAARVVAINLVIGERSSIVDDSLLFYFDMLAQGTLTVGAKLKIQRIPTRFRCNICNIRYEPGIDFSCPECGHIGQLTDEGSEFLIESIVIERE